MSIIAYIILIPVYAAGAFFMRLAMPEILLFYRLSAVLPDDDRDPILLPVLEVLCEEERRR